MLPTSAAMQTRLSVIRLSTAVHQSWIDDAELEDAFSATALQTKSGKTSLDIVTQLGTQDPCSRVEKYTKKLVYDFKFTRNPKLYGRREGLVYCCVVLVSGDL